ncbi:molybdopterin-guanine dinucleotide biosynthesis protein MobA [Corynebacterium diphtheriae]|nr:molybdopterin-guanine dinucleotide biosynthesis protein MobA [Corynebacterium diphtheriae]
MIGLANSDKPAVSIIILAGGHSRRMGSDKAQVRVNDERLIDMCIREVQAIGYEPIVVSGADLTLPHHIRQVSEYPAFGGPVAGIAAGVDSLSCTSGYIGIVAVDAPLSPKECPQLVSVLNNNPDVDVAYGLYKGHIQPLLTVWRNAALRRCLAAFDSPRDQAAKALLRTPSLCSLEVSVGIATRDYDTPAELQELGSISLQ